MTEGNRRAVLAALLANLGIAVAKFVAFGITRSSSMLAEAVHSVADTGNQGLLLLGAARASQAPDAEHPFGYGRERYFWSFVVALILFSLGAMFALYQGVDRLLHPHEIDSPGVALGVLSLGLVFESLSLRTAVGEARRVRGDAGWWAFVRHTKNPELPVVLLEDIGALVGLLLAMAGVGLSVALDDARFDAYATLAIGALLAVIAGVLAAEMKSLLIGEAASQADVEAIRAAIESTPRVSRLIHMRTLHIGPDELLVGAKVELDSELGFAQVAEAINDVETRVRARVPAARMIYIEPDVHLTPAASPAPEPDSSPTP